jgi:hypothetical protein
VAFVSCSVTVRVGIFIFFIVIRRYLVTCFFLPLQSILQSLLERTEGPYYLLKNFMIVALKISLVIRLVWRVTKDGIFNTKFLNVLDPIRDTNNLGRSVNLGGWILLFLQPPVHLAF